MADSSVLERDAMADAVDALLLRVATGDQPAFEALYRSTSGKLLGICLRVLSDRTEAEDVLQDVYVTVWNKAGQFDASRARAVTWMGTIRDGKGRHREVRIEFPPGLRTGNISREQVDAAASVPLVGRCNG